MIRSDDNEDPPVVEWEFEKILDYAKLDNGRWCYVCTHRGAFKELSGSPIRKDGLTQSFIKKVLESPIKKDG